MSAAAYSYVRFTANWQLRALFYGIAPVITFWKTLPEPVVIVAGGVVGLLAYQALQPRWLMQ